MTTENPFVPDRIVAVEDAVRALVAVDHRDEESQVSIPVFYPSGAVATLDITPIRMGFRISDCGLAYREVEMVGGDHLFGRNAGPIAEQFGVEVGKRVISTIAMSGELAGAIADVASASVQLAHRICERLASRNEAEIEALLYERLVALFGQPRVEQEASIAGASSHKWRVSALVHAEGRDIAFEAVSNHHSSVYSSATMFHDLSLLDRRPVAVAVVRDKRAMGDYLGILSQAANVIQDNAPEAAILGLIAA